jgi:ubiquitin carboxyl-terminal hydrolase L5
MNNYDEELYFAKQVIVNACATQAILGILLNNEENLELGNELLELKSFTKLMDPYMKGLSISNCEKVRIEHNKFSKYYFITTRPEPFVFSDKRVATEDDDVYHFVAYIHFKDKVYEIDGLQEGPILIEDNVGKSEWVNKVKPAIINRISLYANNEIKFNLLALVPDRRARFIEQENELLMRTDYLNNLLGNQSKDVDVQVYCLYYIDSGYLS